MNILVLLLISFFINTLTTTGLEGKKKHKNNKALTPTSLSMTITNSSSSTQPIYCTIQTAYKHKYTNKRLKKRHKAKGWTDYPGYKNICLQPSSNTTITVGPKNGTKKTNYRYAYISLEALDNARKSTKLKFVIRNITGKEDFTVVAKNNSIQCLATKKHK